jgi:hypothetical protein
MIVHKISNAGAIEKLRKGCHPREGGGPEVLEKLDSRFRGNDIKRVMQLALR